MFLDKVSGKNTYELYFMFDKCCYYKIYYYFGHKKHLLYHSNFRLRQLIPAKLSKVISYNIKFKEGEAHAILYFKDKKKIKLKAHNCNVDYLHSIGIYKNGIIKMETAI